MTHIAQQLVRAVPVLALAILLYGCASSDEDVTPASAQAGGSGDPLQDAASDASGEPSEMPAVSAGSLVETAAVRTPGGTPLATRVIRLSYQMDANGSGLTTAVALLFLPADVAPSGAHPLVVWAHGTTGISDACAPSSAFDTLGNASVVNRLLEQGYAVLAPDYEGLGTPGAHPYLVRSSHANSLLDAVPAAHQIQGVSLSTSWALVGHSQGGHAVLSAARAEQLNDYPLVAVAALAPGLDVTLQSEALFEASDRLQLSGDRNGAANRIFYLNLYGAYVGQAYAIELDGFQPESLFGQTIAPLIDTALDETACGDFSRVLVDELGRFLIGGNDLSEFEGLRRDWADNPALTTLLDRERFSDEPQTMPLLLVQGDVDEQVDVSVADVFVEQQRAVGTPLEYQRIQGVDHGDVIRGEFNRTLTFLARYLSTDPVITTSTSATSPAPTAEVAHESLSPK